MSRTPDPKPPVRLAVVIPCWREKDHILDVLARIGPEVARIFVIDDACPDGTGEFVRQSCTDERVRVIVQEQNTGVGGATITGYRAALDEGWEIMVKIDGDGQMDPVLIPVIAAPVSCGEADYAKGNRFFDLDGLRSMPRKRILGNLALSFLTKVSSGYWNVFDPTNGFTAIHAEAVRNLPLAKISRSYFFESDMLFRLNTIRAVVADVPMAARYGTETSHLRISRILPEFLGKHARNTIKRIGYGYFLRDFTIASIELVVGTLLTLFGIVFGGYHWAQSVAEGVPATAGTAILAALPIIIGVQLLLAFLNYDTRNLPARPLHRRAW